MSEMLTAHNTGLRKQVGRSTAGVHCLIELHGCPYELLNDEQFVSRAVETTAQITSSTLLKIVSCRFYPQGVTALGLLAESHISIHTWPEAGYAAADIFTCGKLSAPRAGCEYLRKCFKATRCDIHSVRRGQGGGRGLNVIREPRFAGLSPLGY